MTTPSSVAAAMQGPTGRKPQHFTPGRIGLYAFLVMAAMFFLLPLYVMLVTSFKSMPEIRQGNIFAFPLMWTTEAWVQAWSTACTGLECGGISVGFWNSVKILIPSMILSIFISSLTGYALSFWRVRGSNVLFAILLLGAFIPYQVFIYPLVLIYRDVGIYSTLPCIIITHTVFGLPVLTLLFRNYYSSLPMELFKAARIDGAGLWQIFFRLMIPMSIPILVVAGILQVTGIWNDFLFGVVFAGRENFPMTVQLNNIVNSTQGEKLYNVNMAATILTALVPLIVYFGSGRWFVRGITAGAVKG
ncbi:MULTISPECIES: carbohydrate ABC transporter permease [Rhizobium]|jgi:glucose/mannose transport system permease protein|uniref:carbohydrate ABC transporter permease n=1 Tax=Rhizobium TaxID=379 RepID=UPI000DDE7F07|nr:MULTISPECIES: carbohydrate ABC transporter permease [Rhizobium]NKJ04563.1 glucose/mannose transport system permease protein [Rhizobium sp. SG741]NTJ10158.1 carbohydrate ABC transporter permease [Rhizobium lusitanum]